MLPSANAGTNINLFQLQGNATVLQRRTATDDPIEVSRLGLSDYFGKYMALKWDMLFIW